ncbi:MAG: hypothetical protein ABL964_09840 [Steroidobacteraceae bacterium]
MFDAQGRNISNVDGYFEMDIEFAGGALDAVVGYRIISTGATRRQWRDKDGEQVDYGEAPTVDLQTLFIGGVLIPLNQLSGAQHTALESEIVARLEELWA